LQIGLKGIVLRFVDEDAREAAPHEVREIERAAPLELLGSRALRVRSEPVRIEQAAERRHTDDLDLFRRQTLLLSRENLGNERGERAEYVRGALRAHPHSSKVAGTRKRSVRRTPSSNRVCPPSKEASRSAVPRSQPSAASGRTRRSQRRIRPGTSRAAIGRPMW